MAGNRHAGREDGSYVLWEEEGAGASQILEEAGPPRLSLAHWK